MLRKALRSFIRLLFKLLSKVEISGIENIPAQGGCIIAANHLSRLDPPLVYVTVRRDDLTALVAEKYQEHIFFRWIINTVRGIWINRGEADIHALREARDFLRSGGALGIAPEGTRSHTGALIPAKTGTAYLADKAGVPIIPVAITGTENAIHQIFRFHRPTIRIRFGPALKLPAVDRHDRESSLQRNTDEIMCHIAAMLPPRYRGAYAGHPHLKELLAQNGENRV